MALFPNDALQNTMIDAGKAAATHARIHTALPDDTGSNQSTAGLVAVPWSAAATGDLTITGTMAFTGGAAGGPATYIGFWDAAGTTYYGHRPLTGDQTFNAAGEYNVTAGAWNGATA